MNGKLVGVIALLLLSLCIMPVSAANYTASAADITATAHTAPYEKARALDGDVGTFYLAASANWVWNWSNPEGKNITRIYIRSATDGEGKPVAIYTPTWTTSVSQTPPPINTWGYLNVTPTTGFILLKPAPTFSFYYSISEILYSDDGGAGAPSGPPAVNYSCNFAEGLQYPNPYAINCVDSSTATPAIASGNWTLSQPDGSTFAVENASLVKTLNVDGWYGLEYKACNSYGCGFANTTQLINITSGLIPATGISLIMEVRSSLGPEYPLITPADVSIRNTTTDEFGNITINHGIVEFVDILGIPLTQGQTVGLCASSEGYSEVCEEITIPYDGYTHTITLTPDTMAPGAGNWNLIVKLIRNLDHKNIGGEVEVITGVSGPGVYHITVDPNTGMGSLLNISASASALLSATAQGYQSASKTIPVFANSTQTVTFELVQIGQTPVTTPVAPTPTTTIPGGDDPQPVITDPYGNPITTSEGKALWGLDRIFEIIPQIAIIIVSLIFAYIFWRGVDICTNGLLTLFIRKVMEGFIRSMFK